MVLGKRTHQSMPTSEEDAEYEDYDQDIEMRNADAVAASKQLLNGVRYDEDRNYEEDAPGDVDELSDRDAEGEDDDLLLQEQVTIAPNAVEDEDADGSDYDDAEGVGAVKVQPGGLSDDDKDAPYAEEDVESDDSAEEISVYSSDGSDDESEDEVDAQSGADIRAESEVEVPAEEAEEDAEDLQAVNPNCCVICNREEEDAPTGASDPILCCAVCGDNAHRCCATSTGDFHPTDDPERWRCKSCISNALEPEHANLALDSPTIQRRLSAQFSTAPKVARDLLPSQRGNIKPDSHSVFANLILDDDPIDGSRHLRKRKTSSIEPDENRLVSSKQKRLRESITRGGSVAAEVAELRQAAFEVQSGHRMEKRSATPRASRSLRASKIADQPQATIEKSLRTSILMRFKVNPKKLDTVLSKAAKPKKTPRPTIAHAPSPPLADPAPTIYTPHYSQPFYPLIDKEVDESKARPYGGILAEAEADTTKTLPQSDERRLFDKSRQKADDEWKIKAASEQAIAETHKKPRKVSGPASQIECINFGGFEIDTWYAAPYPEEYSCNRVLYICEFCLKYMNSEYVAWRHKMKCSAKCPPGDEIYREGSISMFEVDGRKHPVYCQNLCLLAKLFLGSKTLYYDVEPFLFYVMTEADAYGCHLVGYFSKEKRPSSQNNVSCILTLPIRQRKGYGNLLIDFSYLLTRVEKKSGSPEKPLSDMGLVSYRNYWRLVLCYQLRPRKGRKESLSIVDLSEKTGMTADDIVSALEGLRALVRDPVTKTYALRIDYDFINDYIQKWEDKKYVQLNPDALVWTPYVMGRNNQHLLEHAPPLTAIAHPEEENMEVPGEASTAQGSSVDSGKINGTSSNGDGDVVMTKGSAEDVTTVDAPSSETNGDKPTILPSIPPTRYEVFPPIAGLKKGSRFSMSGTRPAATPRTAPARPRSTARQASQRRAAQTARKTSTRPRRVTGGTGRGPGRWPKGTTKKDFGNADSGPGLPPKDDSDDEDDILYETPGMNRRRGVSARRGKKVILSDDDEDEDDLVAGDVA